MFKKVSLVLTLLLAIGSAFGQGSDMAGTARSMLTAPSSMLQQGGLKSDLKLTGEQAKKVDAILKDFLKKTRSISKKMEGSGRDMSGASAAFVEMATAQKEADDAIIAELNDVQKIRLNQLRWQCLGAKALYEEDLQKALGLSADQIAKISEYRDGSNARMMEAMQHGGASAIKGLNKKDADYLKGLLTPEQQANYKTALGPENKTASKMAGMGF
jgi:hypothetical protein